MYNLFEHYGLCPNRVVVYDTLVQNIKIYILFISCYKNVTLIHVGICSVFVCFRISNFKCCVVQGAEQSTRCFSNSCRITTGSRVLPATCPT